MQYEEFVERVNSLIGGEEPAEAEMAIAATLATLGERISGGEAADLASQLPSEIEDQLHADQNESAEGFSLAEFYERISAREDVSPQRAAEHARAVLTVLSKAASGGELSDIRNQLPDEFEPLFR